jgi:hypothetical protein
MNKLDFELLAASIYLCDNDELTLEQQWMMLKESKNSTGIPEGVIVLVNFEHTYCHEMVDNINHLAEQFEATYKAALANKNK